MTGSPSFKIKCCRDGWTLPSRRKSYLPGVDPLPRAPLRFYGKERLKTERESQLYSIKMDKKAAFLCI